MTQIKIKDMEDGELRRAREGGGGDAEEMRDMAEESVGRVRTRDD